MTDDREALDQRMADALLGLELVSFGSTQAWNASGGHAGLPDDRVVAMVEREDDPPYLSYRRRYEKAFSVRACTAVVEDAEAELRAWRKREKPADDAAWVSLEQLILKDDVGLSPEVIATRRNVHPSLVRRLRKKARQGTEDGLPAMLEPSLTPADKALRARALREQGLSTRDIATRLGTHQTQVMRWIRGS